MNRYLFFGFEDYKEKGGVYDFRGAFNSMAEARRAAYGFSKRGFTVQVFDTVELKLWILDHHGHWVEEFYSDRPEKIR